MSDEKRTDAPEEIRVLCGHSMCKGADTYRLQVACMNCSWKGHITLTRGHEFSRYGQQCPGCGCHSLTR